MLKKLKGNTNTKTYFSKRTKKRRGGRRKLAAGDAYAVPTSFGVTNNVQTLGANPDKSAAHLQSLYELDAEEAKEKKEQEELELQTRKENIAAQEDQALVDASGKLLKQGVKEGKAMYDAAQLAKAAEATKAANATTGLVIDPAQATKPILGETMPGMGPELVTDTSFSAADTIGTTTNLAATANAANTAKALNTVNTMAFPSYATNTLTTANTAQTSYNAAMAANAANTAGTTTTAATSSISPNLYALAAQGVGAGINKWGVKEEDKLDDRTTSGAEIVGGVIEEGGKYAGYGATVGGMINPALAGPGALIGGLVGAGVYTGKTLKKKKEANETYEERLAAAKKEFEDRAFGREYNKHFLSAYGKENQDRGFNIGQGIGGNLGANQMAQAGGINSYFKRGGKVPGGEILPLPGGAVKFVGNEHGEAGKGSDSGIILDEGTEKKPGTEVENGETMDKVVFAKKKTGGKKEVGDYIFSSYLKDDESGKSFAELHEEILERGGSQEEIQDLAKRQEEKAKKVKKTPVGPTDQYGERGKENIAKMGGIRKKYQTSGPEPINLSEETFGEFDPNYLTGEGMAMADVPTGQKIDPDGMFGGVTADQMQSTVSRNPWYDWENFNPSDREDVTRFQQEYNKRATTGNKIKVDGKFGQQTQSAYIPAEKTSAIDPKEIENTEGELVEGTAVQPEPKERLDPLLESYKASTKNRALTDIGVGALQAIPAAYALLKKMDPLAVVSAQAPSKQALALTNMNPERAAIANQATAFNRSTDSGSPSSFALKLAFQEQARKGIADVGNQEARVNASIKNAQAQMEAQRQQFASTQNLRAQMYNAQMDEDRGRYAREEKLGAITSGIDTATGMYLDSKRTRAMDDLARATAGQTGVLDRFDSEEQYFKDYSKAVRKNDTDSPFYNQATGKFMTPEEVKERSAIDYQTRMGYAQYGGRRQYQASGRVNMTPSSVAGSYTRRIGKTNRRS